MDTSVKETPQQTIARVAAAGEKKLTPCGDGHMVSHIWGSGPPLVLLHGNFGSWMHWIRNVEELGRHFRVIAVDIPGFGESATPPEPYTRQSISEIIAAGLIEIVGDEKITLVGFSFGAATASETAHTLGPRMRKLILTSAGRNMKDIHRPPMDDFVKWRDFKTDAERNAAHRRNLEVIMIGNPARIDDLAVTIQRTNAERARLRAALLHGDTSTQNHVPNLKCPVGFIWADRDSTIGPYMHERPMWVHKYRPDARYLIIPDAGHWVAYERPEAYNKALLELAA
jgi:pimeloyl-ACP methyl ester carboxylesterase